MNLSFTFCPADGKFYNGTTALEYFCPELTYGEKPTWNITLKGVLPSVANSWVASVDKDLSRGTEVMCRTQEGTTATASGSDTLLSVPLNTLTTRFLALVDGKTSVPAIMGIYGLDSNGTQVFYCQFCVSAKSTVDPEMAGTVTPVSVTELTQAQLDARYVLKGQSGSPVWGDITGTLSSQTDLANAFASKYGESEVSSAISAHNVISTAHEDIRNESALKMPKSGGVFTGAVSHAINVLPASTVTATLTDGLVYDHTPQSQATYTFPNVTDNTCTHEIVVRHRCAQHNIHEPIFIAPDGVTVINTLGVFYVSATAIIKFLCDYDTVAGWSVMGIQVRD